MEKNNFLIIALILGIFSGYILSNTSIWDDGETWVAKSASEKLDYIWNQATKTAGTQGTSPYPVEMVGITVPPRLGGISIDPTLNLERDQYPADRHIKVAHTHGHLAKFKWEATQAAIDKGFTGAFKGSKFGIVRFSSGSPIKSNSSHPSMGLKFLRNGKLSGDLVVQRSTTPQFDTNFFKLCQGNHFPLPDQNLELPIWARALTKKFKEVTKRPDISGLSSMAAFTENGEKENPKFPFE